MKTKHKQGFTQQELEQYAESLGVDKDKVFEKMRGMTGIIVDGDSVMFKHDVELAIRLVKENRDLKTWEWD